MTSNMTPTPGQKGKAFQFGNAPSPNAQEPWDSSTKGRFTKNSTPLNNARKKKLSVSENQLIFE